MKSHTIIELEDGSLTITAARREGRTMAVHRCLRLPLPDLGKEAVRSVLQSVDGDLLRGSDGAHVILGERRIQHFVTTVPDLAAADVVDFLLREALRVCALPASSEVMVAAQVVRKAPGRRLVIGATAMPRSVWQPLRESLQGCGVRVVGLHSVESCMALAAPEEPGGKVALLECSAGRARFVLADGQSVSQVRRFLLSGGNEVDPSMLVAQLAMELPRTLDWLREAGHSTPAALVLGSRLDLTPADQEMIRGDFPKVLRSSQAAQVAADQASPGLSALALLDRLFAGHTVPSLLNRPHVEMPWRRGHVLALGAAAASTALCAWFAVGQLQQAATTQTQLTEVRLENDRLEQELAELGASIEPVATVEHSKQLQVALGMRRPISRMLAEISNTAVDAIHIESVQVAGAEQLVLAGVVDGATRNEALGSLAQFAQSVRALPYLAAEGHEDIGEVLGSPNCFRFRFSLQWRKS